MLTTAFGLFMTAFAKSYTEILLWFSIVSGLGFGTAWLCCFGTSIYDVYNKKGFSTGLNSALQVAGASISLVGLRWFIERVFGLSGTFIVLALILATAGILGYFLASKQKAKPIQFKYNAKLIWFHISVALVLGIMYMHTTHRLPLFKEAGLTIGNLGILALIGFWINAATEPITGWLFVDKLKRTRILWMLSAFAVAIGNIMLLLLAKGYIHFTLFAILSALLVMLPVPIVPAVNYLAEHHKKDWAPIIGTTIFFANLSMALFGWIGGLFYTWFGNYNLIFLLTSGIALVCAFTFKMRR